MRRCGRRVDVHWRGRESRRDLFQSLYNSIYLSRLSSFVVSPSFVDRTEDARIEGRKEADEEAASPCSHYDYQRDNNKKWKKKRGREEHEHFSYQRRAYDSKVIGLPSSRMICRVLSPAQRQIAVDNDDDDDDRMTNSEQERITVRGELRIRQA